MRVLFVLVLLSAATFAGDGSWTTVEQGASAAIPPMDQPATGNADKMGVRTGPLVAQVFARASTNPFCSDQGGSSSGVSTAWYSLLFSGSPGASEHRWRITTRIEGDGSGEAKASLLGSSWGECLLAMAFSGDNENADFGQLAVENAGGAAVSIGIPEGLRVALQKSARLVGVDTYRVDSPKTTVGPGKTCRVRVDTFAEACVSAKSVVAGGASVSLSAVLHGALTMTGTCRIGEVRVEDVFRAEKAPTFSLESHLVPPTGGLDFGEGTPTDEPTGQERPVSPKTPAVDGGEPDEEWTPVDREEPDDESVPGND